MKASYIFELLLIIALWGGSCNGERETKKDDFQSAPQDPKIDLDETYSARMEDLLLKSKGDLRGISLGDKPRKVLNTEPFEPQETTNKYISYTFPLLAGEGDSLQEDANSEQRLINQEIVDLRYILDKEGRVGKIEMEVYLQTERALDSLSNHIVDYFNRKYGVKPINKENRYIWQPDGHRVIYLYIINEQLTSDVNDYGIRLYIRPELAEEEHVEDQASPEK